MKNLLLISTVAMLSACGTTDCVKTYSAYLDLPTCSDTVTTNCKKQSVVNSANGLETSFYTATKSYKAAHDTDKVTLDIATQYVTAKNSFCTYVDTIGE